MGMSKLIKNKTIYFLTGAAGFVGANLLERLVIEGQEVHILLKKSTLTWRIDHLLQSKKVHVHFGDLGDAAMTKQILSEIRPQAIYHLAARGAYSSQNDARDIFNTNTLGTLNLLEAVKDLPIRLFVNTSSSSEYGAKDHPMTETDLVEPDSYYAISKVSATHLCSLYAQRFQLPIVTFRLFSIYGPWEEPTRLFPAVLNALQKQQSLDMASPITARDFVYVLDVIELYRKIEELPSFHGQVFNVGSGTQTTLEKLTEVAQEVIGLKTTFKWQKMPPKSWDKSIWVANTSKAKEELGWEARTPLAAGLRQFWEWYLTHDQIYHSMLH